MTPRDPVPSSGIGSIGPVLVDGSPSAAATRLLVTTVGVLAVTYGRRARGPRPLPGWELDLTERDQRRTGPDGRRGGSWPVMQLGTAWAPLGRRTGRGRRVGPLAEGSWWPPVGSLRGSSPS